MVMTNYYVNLWLSDPLISFLWSCISSLSVVNIYKSASAGIEFVTPTKTGAQKVFDERLTSCCPTVFVETQSDTPIEMASEAGTDIESIAVQLFNEHPQRKLSERYVNAFYPDPGSNEQQIHEIETLEGEISADEVVPNAECGKCFEGEERDEGVLLVPGMYPQILRNIHWEASFQPFKMPFRQLQS
ncbi:hypothetical protein KY289_031509 [Solanum tuberosum]|nr:hypothetical protein KY289_031509 [Solanum tuberosum]